ncbi:MAG: universal stress protein [Thermoanaerobaculia bacterium]
MLETLDTVVIGTSLTELSDDIVRAGLGVARASGARVGLVHAFQPQWAYSAGPYLTEAFIQETLEVEKRLAEQRLADQIARLGIRKEEIAGQVIAYGPPHRVVIEAAEEMSAGLIVVGSTESPQLSKLFGSTADRVIRKATRPVLMVRGRLPVPPRRVLMPVDLSPLSAVAFRKGLEILGQIARDPGVELEAVFVITPQDRELFAAKDLAPASEAAALEELETFVNRNSAWSGRHPGTRLLFGEVETEIRERAGEWRADLVVLGTHGRGGFERFLLGSVAADVVRRGTASVLVIPPELAPEAVRTPAREVAVFA